MNIRGWLHVNVSPGANVSRVRMSYPGLKNWFVLHVKVTPGLEKKACESEKHISIHSSLACCRYNNRLFHHGQQLSSFRSFISPGYIVSTGSRPVLSTSPGAIVLNF